MTTAIVCDRCGKKPRVRSTTSGWVVVTVARYDSQNEGPRRTLDLCEECLAVFNEAVSRPRRARPANVTPLRAVRP